MKKLFAVIKREYVQRVRTKFFVIATILGPVLMAAFTVVPALMFGIRAGGPTRLAVIDESGRMYARVAKEINSPQTLEDDSPEQQQPPPADLNSDPKQRAQQAGKAVPSYFAVEQVPLDGRSVEEAQKQLD